MVPIIVVTTVNEFLLNCNLLVRLVSSSSGIFSMILHNMKALIAGIEVPDIFNQITRIGLQWM